MTGWVALTCDVCLAWQRDLLHPPEFTLAIAGGVTWISPYVLTFIFSQQLLVLKKSRFLLLTPLQVPRKQFCECPTSPEFLGASLWTWRGLRQLTFKGMPENMPLGLQWQLAQEFLSLQRKRESSLNETRNTDFRALENLVRLISILKNEDSVTTNHSLRIYLLSECNWIFI